MYFYKFFAMSARFVVFIHALLSCCFALWSLFFLWLCSMLFYPLLLERSRPWKSFFHKKNKSLIVRIDGFIFHILPNEIVEKNKPTIITCVVVTIGGELQTRLKRAIFCCSFAGFLCLRNDSLFYFFFSDGV